MTIDKDEAKKIAVDYSNWTQFHIVPRNEGTFETWWQETHPEKISGLTMKEWRQLAELKDVLVEVWDSNACTDKNLLYYLGSVNNKKFGVHINGATVSTVNGRGLIYWSNAKLLPDPEYFWRRCDGSQPVPDGVRVRFVDNTGHENEVLADALIWSEVKFYQIVGVYDE